MVDILNTIEKSSTNLEKSRAHLFKIKEAISSNSELSAIISNSIEEFNKFFTTYNRPTFTAHKFYKYDVPQSSVYNENLKTIDADLLYLNASLKSSTKSTLVSFNYASVVAKEITNMATVAASKVLDLNIISNFTKGKVIVAGDDFSSEDQIDHNIGIETTHGEIIKGGAAIGLKRVGTAVATDINTTVSITPIQPGGVETLAPTPGNVKRFYEGKFFAYIGEQEPEGGYLQIKRVVDPSDVVGTVTNNDGSKTPGPSSSLMASTFSALIQQMKANQSKTSQDDNAIQDAIEAAQNIGSYLIQPPSEEDKQLIRAKMFDNNTDTYWQCEFIYSVPALDKPLQNKKGFLGVSNYKTQNR